MTSMDTSAGTTKPPLKNIFFAYISMLIGFVFPVAAAVGLVMAYLQSDSGHKTFLIRTFWFGLLQVFVGAILMFVLIGYFVLLFWFIWTAVRLISGMMAVNDGRDLAEPKSLGFKAR